MVRIRCGSEPGSRIESSRKSPVTLCHIEFMALARTVGIATMNNPLYLVSNREFGDGRVVF